jgi:hypothetical protein
MIGVRANLPLCDRGNLDPAPLASDRACGEHSNPARNKHSAKPPDDHPRQHLEQHCLIVELLVVKGGEREQRNQHRPEDQPNLSHDRLQWRQLHSLRAQGELQKIDPITPCDLIGDAWKMLQGRLLKPDRVEKGDGHSVAIETRRIGPNSAAAHKVLAAAYYTFLASYSSTRRGRYGTQSTSGNRDCPHSDWICLATN